MPISIGKETGPRGLARISLTAKGRIKVVFDDGQSPRELFPEDNEELMPLIKRMAEDKAFSKSLFIKMDREGTKIFSMSPPGDKTYIAVFEGFVHAKDQPPIPKWVDERKGQKKGGGSFSIPRHIEFMPIFGVIAGPYQGLKIVTPMSYAFRELDDGSTQLFGTGVNKTVEFLERTGLNFVTDDIPYSDNILPFLEELLLDRQVPVAIALNEQGYVSSIAAPPDGVEFKLPKKTVTKPTPKPVTKAAASVAKTAAPKKKAEPESEPKAKTTKTARK
jgi:hypothetical protein